MDLLVHGICMLLMASDWKKVLYTLIICGHFSRVSILGISQMDKKTQKSKHGKTVELHCIDRENTTICAFFFSHENGKKYICT